MGFAVVSVVCFLSAAEACLEIPKTIILQNSPFPFNSFNIMSDSFEYTTPDGMVNTLRCQQNAGTYSWGISTALNGVVTNYGYQDIQSAGTIVADSNETANPTPIQFSNSSAGAAAVFTKQQGQSTLQLNCSVFANMMIMHVTVRDNNGRVISNVRAAKTMGTRSIAGDQAGSGTVDFASSPQPPLDFAACGADLPPLQHTAPATSGSTPVGQ